MKDRHFITALSRGLDVLSCFRSSSLVLGNQDIAERCRLPKSTVSRLTYTLTKLGYLQYVAESAKYRLGSAALALGSAALGRFEMRSIARPLMQELADETGTSVALGARRQLDMVCVEACKGKAVLSLNLEVGMHLPMATSASGRAYLAACTDIERYDVLDQMKEQDPSSYPNIRRIMKDAQTSYRDLGICSSFGEWQPDVNGIAVALRPGKGLPPISIHCGGAAHKASKDYLIDEVRPRLLEISRRIQDGLGRGAHG